MEAGRFWMRTEEYRAMGDRFQPCLASKGRIMLNRYSILREAPMVGNRSLGKAWLPSDQRKETLSSTA
jgi:hypothetical protein